MVVVDAVVAVVGPVTWWRTTGESSQIASAIAGTWRSTRSPYRFARSKRTTSALLRTAGWALAASSCVNTVMSRLARSASRMQNLPRAMNAAAPYAAPPPPAASPSRELSIAMPCTKATIGLAAVQTPSPEALQIIASSPTVASAACAAAVSAPAERSVASHDDISSRAQPYEPPAAGSRAAAAWTTRMASDGAAPNPLRMPRSSVRSDAAAPLAIAPRCAPQRRRRSAASASPTPSPPSLRAASQQPCTCA